MGGSSRLGRVGVRVLTLCAVGAVAARLVGCNSNDVFLADAGPPVCPGCPADPYREGAFANVRCGEQDGVDTLPIETFDNYSLADGTAGAQDLHMYSDGTNFAAGTLHFYVENDLHTHGCPGYEPQVVSPQALCGPAATDSFFPGVFHVFGGPFLSWGGGFGVSLAKLNGRDPTQNMGGLANIDQHPTTDPNAPKDNCCFNGGAGPSTSAPCTVNPDPKFGSVCPPDDAEYAVRIAALDVSQYEGVSFWARRGPTSQAGIRVLVGDKHTDDDLNYLAQREQAATGEPQPLYCQRIHECSCRLDQTCSSYGQDLLPLGYPAGDYCSLPTAPVPANSSHCAFFFGGTDNCTVPGSTVVGAMGASTVSGTPISGFGPSNCCSNTACNDIYPAYPNDSLPNAGRFVGNGAGQYGDPQYYGKPCTPYAFTNGVAGSFCFDPSAGETPAPSSEQCGDHWTKTVDLTTDWHFYMVAFRDMRQQGWAKKAEQLDLHSVSLVRFTWDVGNIDYWIDQVSFYRHK